MNYSHYDVLFACWMFIFQTRHLSKHGTRLCIVLYTIFGYWMFNICYTWYTPVYCITCIYSIWLLNVYFQTRHLLYMAYACVRSVNGYLTWRRSVADRICQAGKRYDLDTHLSIELSQTNMFIYSWKYLITSTVGAHIFGRLSALKNNFAKYRETSSMFSAFASYDRYDSLFQNAGYYYIQNT